MIRGEAISQPHLVRRVDIQGLRAVAVILVVVFHAGLPAPGGYVGVDVFFVISGFVITRLLWAELYSTETLRLRAFYTRRARRLLPALALVLVVVAIGSLFLQSPLGLQQQTSLVGIAASLYGANAALIKEASGGYFATPSSAWPLLHTWTLAVEEQFYLFFPAFLLVAWRLSRRLGNHRPVGFILFAVVTVGLASFLVSALLTFSSRFPRGSLDLNRSLAFFASPTRAWEFAIGSVLVLSEPYTRRLGRWATIGLGFLGIGLVLFAAISVRAASMPFPGVVALVPVLGTALIIIAGSAPTAGVSAVLRWRPLPWIGDLSYGWYLWHWPAIVLTRIVWPNASSIMLLFAALASLIPTWLSFHFLERPIRANHRINGLRAISFAAVCSLLPIVVFSALWLSTRFPSSAVKALIAEDMPHADQSRRCEANLPSDASTRNACTWTVQNASGTVFLIGDSNAGQFAEPLVAAGNGQGVNVTLATFGACPFADVITHSTGLNETRCRNFVSAWMSYLRLVRPTLVILASESAGALQSGNGIVFEDPITHQVASTNRDKGRLWEEGLNRVLRQLSARGVPAVVIHTVPQFASFDLRTCPAFRIYIDVTQCGVTISRQTAENYGRVALASEELALDGVPDAAGVSFIDDICSPSRCSTNRGRHWLYRDGTHLSVQGALTLTMRFDDLVRAHARDVSLR